jgi:hypothetical protein
MASAEGQRVPELFVDDLDVVEFDRHIREHAAAAAPTRCASFRT